MKNACITQFRIVYLIDKYLANYRLKYCYLLHFMSVKLGLSPKGKNRDWRCLIKKKARKKVDGPRRGEASGAETN